MVDQKNLEAYILIIAEPGEDVAILRNLMKIEGIIEASLTYGTYDVHCKINVDNVGKIKEIVEKVRKLKIMSSQTLIVYEKAPRKGRGLRNHQVRKLGHTRVRR
jgi:DNA-binding Lrp family transcriptional regulator